MKIRKKKLDFTKMKREKIHIIITNETKCQKGEMSNEQWIFQSRDAEK